MTTNYQIYGPPSHTPSSFTFIADRQPDGKWNLSVHASSQTCQGMLWSIPLYASIEQQDYQHLIVAQALEVIAGDMLRDLPSNEARARFVASGGLYEQLNVFSSPPA